MFTVRVRVRARAREWNYFWGFFFLLLLCSSDEDLCVAGTYSMTFTTYVRPTVRDVMMIYSKEQYMENLPP